MPYVTDPDPEFVDQLTNLEDSSTAASKATLLTGQRKWTYPPLNGWDGNPFNIVGMNDAFKRKNLNYIYLQILGDPEKAGTIGELMALKLQIDYVAALERAFRSRHCSSIRAKIHAAARKRGQGDTKGLFTGNVKENIINVLFAAHDYPPGEPLGP